MSVNNPIIPVINDPHELEKLFRKDPEVFKRLFNEAWEQNPDSQVLAAWNERLHYEEGEYSQEGVTAYTANPTNSAHSTAPSTPHPAARPARPVRKDIIVMIILATLAAITSRILLHFVEQQAIARVNLVFGVVPFMIAYFIYDNTPRKQIIYALASLLVISAVYLNILPPVANDSVTLAYLHFPIFLWALLGIAFTGNEYRIGSRRLIYLDFIGAFCIFYACLAISGLLLTGLTLQLFRFVGMDITLFYFNNVVIFGVAALAVAATYLVSRNLSRISSLAMYIARIFSPLVLATLLAYLAVIVWVGKNPFLDRGFLLSFNEVLLSVLAITVFSVTRKGTDAKKDISDYINFALIVLALIIDSVALSAIVFRLTSYGITPNRLAVLGINILVWANLIWIMYSYIKFLRNKTGPAVVQNAVTKYLPVYGLWAAFVTFAFPLIFAWQG